MYEIPLTIVFWVVLLQRELVLLCRSCHPLANLSCWLFVLPHNLLVVLSLRMDGLAIIE